jgi:hypothetical protein
MQHMVRSAGCHAAVDAVFAQNFIRSSKKYKGKSTLDKLDEIGLLRFKEKSLISVLSGLLLATKK